MGVVLYNIAQRLYVLFAGLYALVNDKAKKWIAGRKGWEAYMRKALPAGERRIWIHCSSVGEFEQAKPLITPLRKNYPGYKIVVTFFSPSGYEANQKTTLADHIFYLPVDTANNAERFIAILQPSLVIFIKYEFWYHYLSALKKNNIPTLLVSGAFRQGQPFFKPWGGLFRRMLPCFTYFFVQDEHSKQLLTDLGLNNVTVAGDTRYDRVANIAENFTDLPLVVAFKGNKKIFIAGSTWPGDEAVICDCMDIFPTDWKMIIAPHEIHDDHIQKLRALLGHENTVLYSELAAGAQGSDKKILIINNIGMLSRLFAYGDIAFIGGGFQKGGIHNILEPAVFGVPVVFGPVYEKFVEAKTLADLKLVFPVADSAACKQVLNHLISDDHYRDSVSKSLKSFMKDNIGATKVVLEGIRKGKWLE